MNTNGDGTITGTGRDELFGALAHRQRRRVLAVLRSAEGTLTLTDLALELARRDGDGPVEGIDELRVSLYHQHLPKLASAGLVAFDPDAETVALDRAVPDPFASGPARELEVE